MPGPSNLYRLITPSYERYTSQAGIEAIHQRSERPEQVLSELHSVD